MFPQNPPPQPTPTTTQVCPHTAATAASSGLFSRKKFGAGRGTFVAHTGG